MFWGRFLMWICREQRVCNRARTTCLAMFTLWIIVHWMSMPALISCSLLVEQDSIHLTWALEGWQIVLQYIATIYCYHYFSVEGPVSCFMGMSLVWQQMQLVLDSYDVGLYIIWPSAVLYLGSGALYIILYISFNIWH